MIWTQEDEIFYREGKKYLEGRDVGISIGKELGYLEMFEKVLDFMKSIGVSKEHLNDFMNSDLTPKTWRRSTSMLLTREEEAYCDGYAIKRNGVLANGRYHKLYIEILTEK